MLAVCLECWHLIQTQGFPGRPGLAAASGRRREPERAARLTVWTRDPLGGFFKKYLSEFLAWPHFTSYRREGTSELWC